MKRVANGPRTGRKPWRLLPLLLMLALALTGCFGWGAGGGTSDGSFALQGTVVIGDEEETPLGGVVVRVGDQETTTGPDGTFAFEHLDLQGSTMTVTAAAPGFRPTTVLIHPVAGQQLIVTIPLTPDDDPGSGGNDGGNGGDGGQDGGDGPEPPPEYRGIVEARVRLINAGGGTGTAAVAAPPGAGRVPDLLNEFRVRPVLRTTATTVPGEWIVQLNGDYPVQTAGDVWTEAGVQVIERLPDNFYLVAAPGTDDMDAVEERLARLPGVVSVEPNQRVHPVAVPPSPNDPYYSQQWSLPMISIPQAWSITTGSREVVVAVLDTGILPQHPDLAGVDIVHGRNFASGQSATNYTDDATDLSHGTMVAGIIGAMTNNGQGMAGINWNVSIMPVRVMSSRSGGTVAAVGQGIRWAVDNGAHIINMSLAWDAAYNDAFVNQQIEYAASRGVVLVAGAGNDRGRVTMPASHPDVIAVGAVDRSKRVAWYSNYGPELELVAPGGDTRSGQSGGILSTDIVSRRLGYSYQQGTSFASPHVAGIAALMYSAGITDAREIRELLRNTAEDLGTPGVDNYYGYGLVNAYAAVTGADPVKARVGVATADGSHVFGPVSPQRVAERAVATVEGVAPGWQAVFAWIDARPDGILGEGDFAGLAEVNVPEDGAVTVDLALAVWDTLPAAERAQLAAIVNR